jgi:N-methylhydantoinase A
MSADMRIGIDVGGTFTDFVAVSQGRLSIHKRPTTPEDQGLAIAEGLDALSAPQGAGIAHGMTVATNALLERRGAKMALLTTRGFADLLAIGRQNRPLLYSLSQSAPPPLVKKALRFEVDERMDAKGQVLVRLRDDEVRRVGQALLAAGVESVAVVFLFSFLNSDHEVRAQQILREMLGPDIRVVRSSQVLPEVREYERLSTTVIDAYVRPRVAHYLERLEKRLPQKSLQVMQSSGGQVGLSRAAERAGHLILSGPAGGVVGAFRLVGHATNDPAPRIMTLDMGGTSTDVALCDGSIPTTGQSVVSGLPLKVPTIDIHTVGAGGGSIAHLDAGGALRVGPQSAGALPGPVAYGRGGKAPTVTDAHVALGRLRSEYFLGGEGRMPLDESGAETALADLGAALHLSSKRTALGVLQVVNASMERALRRVSVERGHDPRAFTLVPFGGAGPLHACDLAEALGMKKIFIPPRAGVLSALGMVLADISVDASQGIITPVHHFQATPNALQDQVESLKARIQEELGEKAERGQWEAALDLRYQGQSHELQVALMLPVAPAALDALLARFHQMHEQGFGFRKDDADVEAVTLRLRFLRPTPQPEMAELPARREGASRAKSEPVEVVHSPISDDASSIPAFCRADLLRGDRITGPALIWQEDTTFWLNEGWQAEVDQWGNLWVTQ